MCIIIYSPKGHIPKKHLKNSIDHNSHGWGIMFPKGDGTLQILKGMTKDEFFLQWKWIKDLKVPKVFHARISTHGTKSLENCHPFSVPGHDNLAVAHNGIIRQMEYVGDKSDTVHFVERILSSLPAGFQENSGCQALLDDYIGYSKLVFMDGSGGVNIVNEKGGSWVNGLWYSNSTWCGSSSNSGTLGFKTSTPWTYGHYDTKTGAWTSNGGKVTYWNPNTKSWEEKNTAAQKDPDLLTEAEWVASKCPSVITEVKDKATHLTGGDKVFMSAAEWRKKVSAEDTSPTGTIPVATQPRDFNHPEWHNDKRAWYRVSRIVASGNAQTLSNYELVIYAKHGGALTDGEKQRIHFYQLANQENAAFPIFNIAEKEDGKNSAELDAAQAELDQFPCRLPPAESKYVPDAFQVAN